MRYLQTIVLLLILILTGCNENKEQRQVIDRAEAIIESHPAGANPWLKPIKAPDWRSGRFLARWRILAGKLRTNPMKRCPLRLFLNKLTTGRNDTEAAKTRRGPDFIWPGHTQKTRNTTTPQRSSPRLYIRQPMPKLIMPPGICTATLEIYLNIH